MQPEVVPPAFYRRQGEESPLFRRECFIERATSRRAQGEAQLLRSRRRSLTLPQNLVREGERKMRFLKSQANAPAQLACDIVAAIESGANLQPEHRAIQ
jgi:hypothetical protein